jgi:predicted membrane protein
MDRLQRFSVAVRRYWKRITIGAMLAWLLVNAFLVALVFFLEARQYRYDDYDLAYFAYFLLIASFPIGALFAYGLRPKKVSQ